MRTAAGLPVTDGQAQPMGSEKMTSSPREVWNWRSSGWEVGGGRRRAGGGAPGALKRPKPIGHPAEGRAADRLDFAKLPRGQCREPLTALILLTQPDPSRG